MDGHRAAGKLRTEHETFANLWFYLPSISVRANDYGTAVSRTLNVGLSLTTLHRVDWASRWAVL